MPYATPGPMSSWPSGSTGPSPGRWTGRGPGEKRCQLLSEAGCDARIINLETSITTSDDFAPGKGVHYRMQPANLGALSAVQPDVCVLANNHVIDFGRRGLLETLDVLAAGGLNVAGAGRTLAEARMPAIVPTPRTRGRVIVLAAGTPSSGIPLDWAATDSRPGVNLLARLTPAAAEEMCQRAAILRQPGDLVVVSVHWGGNWGYRVPSDQVRFAHQLIDGGIDLVHGHSSHHPRPIEVYRGKLILYGCGDLVDDYEGITGHEQYRNDLRLLYLARLDPGTGRLLDLQLAPLQARRMRLQRANEGDVEWLRRTLDRVSRPFGVRIDRRSTDSVTMVLRGGTRPT